MIRFAIGLAALAAPLAFFAPTLAADDTSDYFATRLLDDASSRVYLEMASDDNFLDLAASKLLRADLNGDAVDDYLLSVHNERSALVSAFIANSENDELDTSMYAGFIALDAESLPTLRLEDVTGDGVVDLRVEAIRKIGQTGIRRVVKFASFEETTNKLNTIFFAMLDGVEREGINKTRSTHLIRIKDANGDGINEIEVSARSVELIGDGNAEREIPESISMTRALYILKDGVYQYDSTKTSEPTVEERLIVAAKLEAAGEHQRAALTAHSLLQHQDLPTALVERARTIVEEASSSAVLQG